ncbi:uncharacterized protein LOC117792807 [Drosophila innubila]|uniref:uncharacterized protein LOC117792807 n=1 Tax=Drosophila innubila TaxID=198719 RepID=UPI00148D911E|nr:uncharacterized protein LOC117792807 [Drosophila innubila]
MDTTLEIWSMFVVLLTFAHGQSITTTTTTTETHTETETTEYGPISMVVDQLAGIAVDVSDQTSSQLQGNIERALSAVTGNIESLTTNAMDEMERAIIEANQFILDNPSCNPAWNLQEFTANVTHQLGGCTLNLGRLVEAFRRDGQKVMADVQSFIQQMAQLPIMCQGQQVGVALGALSFEFDNSNNCFMRGITAINQGLALAMHNASLFLLHTRQLSQEQVAQSQQCTDAVVYQVLQHLSAQRANCS